MPVHLYLAPAAAGKTHYLIQQVREITKDLAQTVRVCVPGSLQAQAQGYGLTGEAQVKDAVEQSRRLLAGFQSHSLYGVMNGASRRLHEVPYSFLINGAFQSGSIDALFLQDNVWTIVNFITNRIQNEIDREHLLSTTSYLTQIQQDQQAVKQMLGQDPQVILCWLNYAGAVQTENSQTALFTL